MQGPGYFFRHGIQDAAGPRREMPEFNCDTRLFHAHVRQTQNLFLMSFEETPEGDFSVFGAESTLHYRHAQCMTGTAIRVSPRTCVSSCSTQFQKHRFRVRKVICLGFAAGGKGNMIVHAPLRSSGGGPKKELPFVRHTCVICNIPCTSQRLDKCIGELSAAAALSPFRGSSARLLDKAGRVFITQNVVLS